MVDRVKSKGKVYLRSDEEQATLQIKNSQDCRRYRKALKTIRDMTGPTGDHGHRMKAIAKAELEKG